MKFKKFALVMAIMLLVTACAGEAPQLIDFLDNENSTVDFEGMTFRIYRSEGVDLRYAGEDGVVINARQEKLLKHLDSIEKDYNCTIITRQGIVDDFSMSYVAGIPVADFVYFRLNRAYSMYLADYFIPMNEISTIDLDSGKYGSEALLNALTWNGDVVGFEAAHWGIDLINFSNATVYNPEIFTMINLPTPNEYYEQGEWNWDTLKTVGKACVSISTSEHPVYLAPSNNYFFRMLLLSNGGEYITEDENGKYSYGLLDPRVTEALQFGNDLYEDGLLEQSSGDYASIVNKFSRNTYALMCEYGEYGIGDLISTEGNNVAGEMQALGYCYMPDGPQATDNTIGVISNESPFYHVTREKSEDIELLGTFMEFLFASLDEDPEEWREEFKTMNFFDSMSAEVYMTQLTNSYFDRIIFAYTDDSVFERVATAGRSGSIAESLQSMASSINAKLDEGINAGK